MRRRESSRHERGRAQMIEGKRLLVAMMGICFSGCLYGYVDDAVTGNAIQGVTVKIVKGTCTGTGCTNPNVQLTDSSGLFGFDAYGNIHGSADVQLILPAGGEEAVQFAFSKPGYTTVNLYHRPNYQQVQDGSGN